jgi:glycosyltransferase involved in cell wall biosynthesis
MNTQPLVSVVLATRNEEKNIKRILLDLQKQTYKNIEIIHIDNNSSDKTREISQEILGNDNVYNLSEHKSLHDVMNYRGCQVNFGVEKSKGDIIFFPDADMTFNKELIKEAVNLLKNQYDALYIPEVVLGQGLFGKIRNFERSFYNQTCIDAVRFVKRSIFKQVGGFDEKNIPFAPDDWDLTKTLKKHEARFSITKYNKFHHEEWLTLTIYLSKKGSYIWTFSSYISKWGKNDPDIKKQFGLFYRYFGVFIEQGKWKKLLRHPILTFGMYFLRFLVGVKYIMRSKS